MKRAICLFMSYQFIIMNVTLYSSNIYAQEDSGRVQCTDEYKLKKLVEKGIMTKDTCFQIEGDSLKLNVTGRTYKLAQTLDTQVTNSTAVPNGGIVCEGITGDIDGDEEKVSESDFLNKTAFARFGQFLRNLKGEVYKLRQKLIKEGNTEEAQAIKNEIIITGTGYADGVRVVAPAFDQEIFSDANNALYKPAFKILGKENESFPNKRAIFKEIACAFNKDQGSVTDLNKLKFLHKIRNIAIAKRRANNLSTVIRDLSEMPNNTILLEAFTSDKIADDKNAGCYGYCALRRGATVDIHIPGLSYFSFEARKEDVEIAPVFNSPTTYDQVVMNAIAQRTFSRDYEKWLLSKIQNSSSFQDSNVKALLYLQSISTGTGRTMGELKPAKANYKTFQMLP
jgi:hypothetical protein